MAYEGIVNNIDRRFHDSPSDFTREQMRKYMTEEVCETCEGYRLNEQAMAVKINGEHIGQVVKRSIGQALKYYEEIELTEKRR